ncbi:hypothetical protein, partial [uncultured Algoriphagus sp.]|uniref:hypothetical protein n=1 Tax=uncultured Algoriphagus sp. TaxID=417365 RepID=UPI0030EDA7F3
MTYQEAIEYREKNLHLIGEYYKGSPIKGIFIYPKDEALLPSFMETLYLRNVEPIITAALFPTKKYGLKIYLDMNDASVLMHLDISMLPEEMNFFLPEDY